jgi:hypothetical protein
VALDLTEDQFKVTSGQLLLEGLTLTDAPDQNRPALRVGDSSGSQVSLGLLDPCPVGRPLSV